MGQIAQQLAGSQTPGTLPSGTMINLREHNNVRAVVTISGKSAESFENKQVEEDELFEVDLEIRDHEKKKEEVVVLPMVEKEKQKDPKPTIKLLYPQRTKKKKKNENFFEKFLEMFKKHEINIPFSEDLQKMTLYAKFMKDIVSKKHPKNTDPILLTETCSSISQGMKIPVKKKYRGSVTILCIIWNIIRDRIS